MPSLACPRFAGNGGGRRIANGEASHAFSQVLQIDIPRFGSCKPPFFQKDGLRGLWSRQSCLLHPERCASQPSGSQSTSIQINPWAKVGLFFAAGLLPM